MKTIALSIGKDFTRYPAGRFREDGPFSGQEFRDGFLLQPLQRGCRVEVDLDSAAGYGSSFLEEAFGGLVREGVSPELIKNNLILVTSDEGLRQEIWCYVDEAINRREG